MQQVPEPVRLVVPPERRLNWGLQSTSLTGFPVFPVAKESLFHRSINLRDDMGLHPDFGRERRRVQDNKDDKRNRRRRTWGASGFNMSGTQGSKLSSNTMESQQSFRDQRDYEGPPLPLVRFVGYATWHMDGHQTRGEMDRHMMASARSKYPCSRPATLEEYRCNRIEGLAAKNLSGFDVVFVGPDSTEPGPLNAGRCYDTLGVRKRVVFTGDAFNGQYESDTGVLTGEKSILCVIPVDRYRRQTCLATHGVLRDVLDLEGNLPEMRRSQMWGARSSMNKSASLDFQKMNQSVASAMNKSASSDFRKTNLSDFTRSATSEMGQIDLALQQKKNVAQ